MSLTLSEAEEMVESVFDFDHVGDAMFGVRHKVPEKSRILPARRRG